MKIDKRKNLTTQLSYIAGFIDGEGCIRIKKSNQTGNSYYITLQVTNSDPRPLLKIKEIFGGKVYFQEKKLTGKIIWQYYITCVEATDALRALSGFLISKKDQALLAIEFQDTKELLAPDQKRDYYNRISRMKKHIYENPELLEDKK